MLANYQALMMDLKADDGGLSPNSYSWGEASLHKKEGGFAATDRMDQT